MPKSTPSAAPPPLQLAHFEILRRLGAGGMAEVFLAKKRGAEGTFKLLVVKRILPSYGASRRFRTMFVEEAQVATRLNHPNVVQVYEFHDAGDEGQLLAMEYVEGPDLGGLMTSAKGKDTRVPPWVGAWIIAEAAKGLHYAHEKKDEGGAPLEIVHRDVSPQNVLLSFEGAVKIADFGIASAKLFSEEAGVLKGKYGYMSPEQARGEKVDRRSDVYALGVILWEILAGRPLHGGLGGEALLDIVRSGVVEPPSTYVREIPDELEAIAMKALSAKRDDRFQSAREMQNAIARVLQKQELVDAATVEHAITTLFTREATRPGQSEPPDADRPPDQRTIAAVPAARSSTGEWASALREGTFAAKRDSSPPPPSSRASVVATGPREVRHVAIVTMHLDGVVEGALAERALDRLRGMLNEIAYKHQMKWSWQSAVDARAIAGLTSNASRAAVDASWLALDIHEAIGGMRDDLPMPVGAAIGIVRGIASGWRDPEGNLVRYKLHDPAGYLADMLSETTPLHRTWVAGGVYRLVRREFRWGDAPNLELRPRPGLEVPPSMRIYALERSLSKEERSADMTAAASDLVGRDAEKADLHAAYHQAVSGHGGGGVVTPRAIVGELGIGKTALTATFLSELPPNARLIRVECSPVRMEVPFSATADLVRDAIGTTGEEPFEEVAQLIARAGGGSAQGDASNPMVARLAELATNRQVGHGDDDDAHYRKKLVVSGVRALLAAIAMQQPLVVVVDGLHWADRSSLDLVVEIIKSPDPLPILLILLTRPDDRVAPLLEGVVRVELNALTTDEQVRLVETRLGVREGVRAVCADLMPRVGGNPFFLLEMVDALLEKGALEIREAEIDGETQPVLARAERDDADMTRLPSTLEQLLADRIHELPRAEHAIVDWLAIAGGPLAAIDLQKLGRGSEEEALVRLCARGLCDRKGEHVDFRHPLTRDVAYAALDGHTRTRMHRELGEHLAQTSLARGLSAAIVARHLARGEAGGRAVEFYIEAANAARAGYQTQLAIRYFLRALQHMPPGDARILGAHEALEAIYRVLGRRKERVKHLEALRRVAKDVGTPRAVCLALLRTARFDLDEGKLSRGLPIARRAADVSTHAGLATAQIEAEQLVSEFLRELGDVQGALAACDRALAACDPKMNTTVPPRMRAEVLRSRGILLRRVGRVREAVDAYVDAIAVFRRVGARRQEARAKNALAFAMFVQGRYEDAIALALESIQIDLSIGGRFQLAKTLTNIGQSYSRVGDLPRALAYLKRARDAHERYGDQDGRADTLITSAAATLEAGQVDEAEHLLGDAAALNAATGNRYDSTYEKVVRAAVARARGEPRMAIDYSAEARRAAENQALVSFQFYGLALEAAARVDVGETHAATLLATTALGAVENLQGCEYGMDIRALCADALARAGSPQAPQARQRAVDFAKALLGSIRDPRLRRLFARRPVVAGLGDPDLLAAAADRAAASPSLESLPTTGPA